MIGILPEQEPLTPEQQWAMDEASQQESIRLGIEQLIRAQMASNVAEQRGLMPQVGGMAAKQAFPGFSEGLRSTARYATAPLRQVQTYITGGKTTAAAAADAAADAGGVSLGDAVPYAGAAYNLYNSYNEFERGNQNAEDLRHSLRAVDDLSDSDEMRLRDKSFEAGMDQAELGGAKGTLSGLAVGGPIGGVVGGVAGMGGGLAQALQSYRGAPGNDAAALAHAAGRRWAKKKAPREGARWAGERLGLPRTGGGGLF